MNAPEITSSQKGIVNLIFGILCLIPSIWFLFFKVEIHKYPSMIIHFAGIYSLFIGLGVAGVLGIIRGIYLIQKR